MKTTTFFRIVCSCFFIGLPAVATAQPAGLDIVEYALSMRLNLEERGMFAPRNTLSATARITFANTNEAPTTQVPVIVNRLLRVEAVRSGDGAPLDFRQRLTGLGDWESYQANAVTIALDRPLTPGGTAIVEIDYTGQMRGIEESGMLYVQDSLDPDFTIIRAESASYPHLADPTRAGFRHRLAGDDVFDQVVTVTAPNALVVASGLELSEKSTQDEWTTWTYRSRQPGHQIIVTAAPYELIETVGARVYSFPDDREGAQRVSRGIAAAMALFESWFGVLQDPSSFAVAEIPEGYGSQALRPTVIQDARAFRDASAMRELYHEISHFWNVADPDPEPSRWNEGLAMYLQEIAWQTLHDAEDLAGVWENAFEDLKRRYEEHPEYRDVPLARAGEMGMTSVLSYRGGQLMFALLHYRLGQEQLLDVLAEFFRMYAETGATSAEFADFVVTHAPHAKRIIDEWFLGTDYSDLVLEQPHFADLVRRYATN